MFLIRGESVFVACDIDVYVSVDFYYPGNGWHCVVNMFVQVSYGKVAFVTRICVSLCVIVRVPLYVLVCLIAFVRLYVCHCVFVSLCVSLCVYTYRYMHLVIFYIHVLTYILI